MTLLARIRPTGFRRWPLGLVWLALAGPQARALAFDGPSSITAPGAWEISEADGPRKCRIMLRPAPEATAPATLGMPAGCRRAFPFLGKAGLWNVSEDHRLALKDRDGQVVLAFAPADEDRLVGKGPDGEIYALEQVGRPRHVAPVVAPPVAAPRADAGPSPIRPLAPRLRSASPAPDATATIAANETAVAADPVAPVVAYPHRPTDVAGRYIILREEDRDIGCLLTLDGSARGPGGHRAQLAPACRDQGVVVFDPVGWRFERGQLVLRARKGHDLRLRYHSDGVWRKDPKEGGKPFGLKKI